MANRAELFETVKTNAGAYGYFRLKCPCGGVVYISRNPASDGEGTCDKCEQLFSAMGTPLSRRARDVDYSDAGERYEDD